jgi:hypothetical protein
MQSYDFLFSSASIRCFFGVSRFFEARLLFPRVCNPQPGTSWWFRKVAGDLQAADLGLVVNCPTHFTCIQYPQPPILPNSRYCSIIFIAHLATSFAFATMSDSEVSETVNTAHEHRHPSKLAVMNWRQNGYPVEQLWDEHASVILLAAFDLIWCRQNLRQCLHSLDTHLDNMLTLFWFATLPPPLHEACSKLEKWANQMAVCSRRL